jgi:hypothetical protein
MLIYASDGNPLQTADIVSSIGWLEVYFVMPGGGRTSQRCASGKGTLLRQCAEVCVR